MQRPRSRLNNVRIHRRGGDGIGVIGHRQTPSRIGKGSISLQRGGSGTPKGAPRRRSIATKNYRRPAD